MTIRDYITQIQAGGPGSGPHGNEFKWTYGSDTPEGIAQRFGYKDMQDGSHQHPNGNRLTQRTDWDAQQSYWELHNTDELRDSLAALHRKK